MFVPARIYCTLNTAGKKVSSHFHPNTSCQHKHTSSTLALSWSRRFFRWFCGCETTRWCVSGSLVTVDSRHLCGGVQGGFSPEENPERPWVPQGKPWYTSALSWKSPSRGCSLGFPAHITALDLEKQGKTEEFRDVGNLLVCVNHPANRHLRPLLALATEMRLRLSELKGTSFKVFKIM